MPPIGGCVRFVGSNGSRRRGRRRIRRRRRERGK